ncbi:efflux ABC transporter, permease protein [Ruminococcus albus 8]|uniref:Efflux ABC transporter, permease protein n=2 Tax=Ruminococcus albus TaxID=1264 RepID=E9SCC4_RUMAL|nr:efflux ABC transporter, permease protein [Ruminococcus albus 8]
MMNNIVFRVTRKYMSLNRRRTAIAFMGIVLMVVMMTCVFVGKQTVMAYLDKVASLDKGSWHLIAYDLTPEEAKSIMQMEDVKKTGISEQLYNMEFQATGDPDERPFIDVKAYSAECFEMNNITLAEGRFPENSRELIISKTAIEDGSSIKIGDRITGDFFKRSITNINDKGTLEFPFMGIEVEHGKTAEVPVNFMSYIENDDYVENHTPTGVKGDFTVVGIMERPTFEKISGASISALCGLEEATGDNVNLMIYLDTEKAVGAYDLESRINSMTGRDNRFETNEMLLAFSAMSGDSNINTIVIFVEIFFTVFIMAASVILIYNVFNMSFAERTKYLGMLSSVGATRRQKRQSIYFESFALLLPALPSGILLGMGLVYGASQVLKPRFDTMLSIIKSSLPKDIPLTLSFGVSEILVIIVMCVVTVLVSALIPAIKIGRIAPVESAKGAAETVSKKHYRTSVKALEKGRPELLLAVNSTSRSGHLTKSIIRSIAVFTTLIMVTLYGAQSLIKIVETKTEEDGWMPDFDDYEYVIVDEHAKNSYSNVKEILEKDENVGEIKEIVTTSFDVTVPINKLTDEVFDARKAVYMQFDGNTEEDWEKNREIFMDSMFVNTIEVDDEEFALLASKGNADMDIAEDTSKPAVLLYNESAFSTDFYISGDNCSGYKYILVDNVFNVKKGDEFILNGMNSVKGEVEMKLATAGFVDADSVKGRFRIVPNGFYIFINRAAGELIYDSVDSIPYSCMFFNDDNEESVKRLSQEFSRDNESAMNSAVMARVSELNAAKSIKQVISEIVKILAYCFTAMISLVCLLNLYNSIRGRAAERTKETASLRSIGMTDKQFTKMHNIENIILLSKGLLISAVLCTVLCLILRYVMVRFFGNVRMTSPLLPALGISAAAAVISSVMTGYCSRRSKVDIISEIRRETV